MLNSKEAEKIILDIYRDLYKNATPSADFDKLLDEAKINENGQKEINYMSYEIDDKLMDDIVLKHLKASKFKKDNYWWKVIKMNVYLGCSPKSIIKE